VILRFSRRDVRNLPHRRPSGTLYNYSCVEPASGKKDTMRNHFKIFMLLGILSAILIAVGVLLGSFLLQMGISRSRQCLADEIAARLTNEPEVLAKHCAVWNGAPARLHLPA
jgi:hypothetical protein